MLTGLGAAAGIGLINSIGNLSGFIGPYLTGYLFNLTGSYTPGFLVIAALVGAGGLGMVFMPRNKVTLGNASSPATATVGGKA